MLFRIFLFALVLFSGLDCASLKTSEFVAKLVDTLSYEEKCGQMTQVTFDVIAKLPEPTDPDENPVNMTKLRDAIINYNVGSILNVPYDRAVKTSTWQKILQVIQEVATKETKSKIPIIYGLDSIHGANYVREAVLFPQPINMAASFEPTTAYKIGAIVSMETRATGIPWNFSPVLDVGRQMAWSRLFETLGEDVLVVKRMSEAYIRGHQGNGDLTNRNNTAVCLKHYIGYSDAINGRDRSVAWIPENLLREVFLPPFEVAVKAGSVTVMINSGDVNGIPGHANYHYLTEILKDELKMDGFTVSDWVDIIRLHERDFVAETPEEAVRMAVMAGVDMSMVPFDFSFYKHCVDLTKKDARFAARVNDATTRILRVKEQLGLFKDPFPVASDVNLVGTAQSEQVNLEAAREGIVLAKNEQNVLPLSKNARVLVTGPTSNLLRVLNGGWSYSWQGTIEELYVQYGRAKMTVNDAVKRMAVNADFSQGVNLTHIVNLNETLDKARQADVIVLCVGEDTYTEQFGIIDDLHLDSVQRDFAQALFNAIGTSKPVVLVYLGGRPRIITSLAQRAQAVLIAFLPGNRGGEAIAEILFGDVNPSAKMPITYPRAPNGITLYDARPVELSEPNGYFPLFGFGHGLSYTTFSYSGLRLNTTEVYPSQGGVSVTVTVTNTGSREGKEVVMLYLNDEYSTRSRAKRQLKDFKKVSLRPGESQDVTLVVSVYDMSFVGLENTWVYEAGKFNLYVSDKQASFMLKESSTTPTATATTRPVTNSNAVVITTSSSSSILLSSMLLLVACAMMSVFWTK